ncbi:amino acid adenylation domain-containing protein [Kitasatospora sp. NPDC127059]|uniref:amino acid adenylation domain-containing protein n=1 Tax=unclassified Kitasatospora TaxID=2633591 RepID=UPI0036649A81
MTDLQHRIAALPPERRALLEARLAELVPDGESAAYQRIRPRDRSRPTPLGVAQQREWAIGRFRSANNITGALRLEGALDLDLLGRVLGELLDRHEVLRSTVEMGDGRAPVQVVHPLGAVPLPVVDLSGLSPEQQDREVRRHHTDAALQPFDPADPLRLRVTVLRLAADVHELVFATDHAASDAWSLTIIVQEFATLYGLRHSGRGDGLPRPEIQFGDFAEWQRERLDADRLAAEVGHWRETLAGMPTGWSLPVDRPYPARPAYTGDVHLAELPPELAARVRRFCEQEHASLFTVLLAACSVLLSRYLGQDDLVIGSLVSGRTRVETERLIGCFANPLPLRMRMSDDQSLREVVRRARETLSTALDHQDLPYDLLIEELGIGRESAQTSLSPMWINVLSVPEATMELPGVRVVQRPMAPAQTSVDLSLNVLPVGDRLLLQWHYMNELFDASTVALLAEQFTEVLQQVVTAPDTPVWAVELASAAPSAEAPGSVADGSAGPDRASAGAVQAGFVELFQRRAALTPHAPAVVCDGLATSYAELNRQANRLAHHLRGLGVGRDTPVGVLVDRSPRLAVAILGVLKAGGCYVPMDPGYPSERLALMLEDSGAEIVVTEERPAGALSGIDSAASLHAVLLDGPAPFAGDTDHDPLEPPAPDSLAYVVYTSGSTGRPKGAMIEHRSLAVFARDIVDRLGLGAGDRFLQFASPSFDVLVEELFPIWVAGGAVVIPTRHLISGEDDLVALTERERVTVMELPTAYWHAWARELDRLDQELPSCLRLVIIGGERVLPERIALWRRTGVPLMHVYGLTETTVSSTFFHLDPADPVQDWPNLPIGTALPSADLRVLDRRLRPVPRGGTGELYIGGVSLARGYLGRAALTAARFIADPTRSGERLYRTGDLVRHRPDGNLEFISRVDTQIKIRGFRVEPTEIESTLTGHPAVAEAVVVAFEPVPGDRRLVAYVVPRTAPGPGAAELRGYLEGLLPAYLVPSAFIELDALPLNANGKIDRDRLPRPDGEPAHSGEEYVAPQSATQEKLAEIVASVVGVGRIGIQDNFFEVGGDSILAIQVVARAQESGLRLTPYDLFAHPTVASLAEVVAGGQTVDAEQGEVTGPVPLAAQQRRFCAAGLAEPQQWNTSVLLALGAPADPALLRRAVEEVLTRNDGLRQRFLMNADRTRVRIAPSGGQSPFDVHDLSGLDQEEQDRRLPELLAQLQAGLDPAVGPLLRVALVRLGGQRPDRLAVVAHRLVADAPSLRIVLADLETAMVQLSTGEELRFPPKTTSWQSWNRRLRTYAGGEELEAQRAYWAGLVAVAGGRLPQEPAGAPEQDTEAATRTVTASLDRAETDELLHTVPGALDCGVEEVLLAALARVLTGWSGAARHLVDLERHDREPLFDDVDLARTVGWFSRTHPLALASEPQGAPATTLASVKESLRAVPAAGLGWELLCAGPDPLPDPEVELSFGYLGPVTAPVSGAFGVEAETIGGDRHPDNRRPYPVEVRASVVGGTLELGWSYSGLRHQDSTMSGLVARHLDEVRALIGLSRGDGAAAPAPSDFPFARVDQGQLDALFNRLGNGSAQ